MLQALESEDLRRISCHGRNYSQPYFFKRNQSSDNRSHGFGDKFLLKKLSASNFSYERKSAFRCSLATKAKHRWKEKMIKTCVLRFSVFTTELRGHVFFIFNFG